MSHRKLGLFKKNAGFGFGNALTFGDSDKVDLDSGVVVNGAFILSFWMNLPGFVSSRRFVTNSGGNDRLVTNSSTAIAFIWTVSQYIFNFASAMSIDTWVHVVWTRAASGGAMDMWVDGVGTTSTNSVTTALTLQTIGYSTSFLGIIDEFAILAGTEATQTNVDDLYNGGDGANFEDVMGPADVYLQLNESGTATTAVDTSANGNDGTLNNFPASGMWNAR